VVEVDPGLADGVEVRVRLVEALVDRGPTVAWSRAAATVSSGMVLTVSGPISASTYIVSG